MCGIIVALITVGLPLWLQVNSLKSENSDLKIRLQEKTAETQRLETLLTPFRTIALDRYPGEEKEALSRLAEDVTTLQQRLDKALGVITTFEAEIALTVTANWVRGSPPTIHGIFTTGGADSYLNLRINSGGTKRVDLHLVGSATGSTVNETSLVVRYRAVARPGSWPIGEDLRDILGCEGGRAELYGIHASLLEDNELGIPSIQLRVFVNGVEHFTFSYSRDAMLNISSETVFPRIKFRGYRPFNKES